MLFPLNLYIMHDDVRCNFKILDVVHCTNVMMCGDAWSVQYQLQQTMARLSTKPGNNSVEYLQAVDHGEW